MKKNLTSEFVTELESTFSRGLALVKKYRQLRGIPKMAASPLVLIASLINLFWLTLDRSWNPHHQSKVKVTPSELSKTSKILSLNTENFKSLRYLKL